MDILETVLYTGLVVLGYMTVLFILAMVRKDNSIADIAWGPGFITASWFALLINGNYGASQFLAAGLVTVWGLRLATRIYRRNRGRGEDPRYAKWREDWGKHFALRSYLQVFVLQGLILMLNVTPVLIIMSGPQDPAYWAGFIYIGAAVWCAGFFFESLGDWQLDRFLADPANRGTINDRGLWKYSRHPNYFGECTMWWGIFLIALQAPWGWVGALGPLAITGTILFVSGIPMTERMMVSIPGWEEYKRRTSPLVPWFPKPA
jgi:steroid 5-alpha reductase family enzyme